MEVKSFHRPNSVFISLRCTCQLCKASQTIYHVKLSGAGSFSIEIICLDGVKCD